MLHSTDISDFALYQPCLILRDLKDVLPKIGCHVWAYLWSPFWSAPGRESYLILYPLSFAMIHSMLLSKLPSLTRFSSQPLTSHWCTKKITFLYFWQCFYNKRLISQRFLTSIDCVPYTSQSNILTNPFSYESIVVQRTHHTFTKSSRCAGITTFLISAKSYSRFIVNYPTYL